MSFLKVSQPPPTSPMASDDLDNDDFAKPVLAGSTTGPAVPAGPVDVAGQLKDLARAIKAANRKIERSAASIVLTVIEMGENLAEARSLLAAQGSRGFGRFLKTVKVSQSGAYRAIQCWETFSKVPTVGRIELRALYMLAKQNTPQAAIDAAVQLADENQPVTATVARQLIAKATGRPEKPARPVPTVIKVPGGSVAVVVTDGASVVQVLLQAIKAVRDQKSEVA